MGYYELTAKMKLKVVDSHPEPNNCAMIVIFFCVITVSYLPAKSINSQK